MENGAEEQAGIIPVFEGLDEENGERSDTVRPSLASRPMSLPTRRLLLHPAGYEDKLLFSIEQSCEKIFLAGQRHFLRSVVLQWVSPDTGTVQQVLHAQQQLAREDLMAAETASIGRNHASYVRYRSKVSVG